jgi:hypothetical protein
MILASQRVAIAKIGGEASKKIRSLLSELAAARKVVDDLEWSMDQWQSFDRLKIDQFAEYLLAHACSLPVVYYVEWSDYWSMGDIFHYWLKPPGGFTPIILHGNKFEVFAYALPDDNFLARHLEGIKHQQFDEYDLLKTRLLEAVRSWDRIVNQSIIVLLREVFGGIITDEELLNSMNQDHDWISKM